MFVCWQPPESAVQGRTKLEVGKSLPAYNKVETGATKTKGSQIKATQEGDERKIIFQVNFPLAGISFVQVNLLQQDQMLRRILSNNNNDNNYNNSHIERRSLRSFTVSLLGRELSPACTL